MEGIPRKRRQLSCVLALLPQRVWPTTCWLECMSGCCQDPERRLATVSMMVMDEDVLADRPLGQLTATGGRYE